MYKVKSHIGVSPNVGADAIAKKALDLEARTPQMSVQHMESIYYTRDGPLASSIYSYMVEHEHSKVQLKHRNDEDQNFWRRTSAGNTTVFNKFRLKTSKSSAMQKFVATLSTRRYYLIHNRNDELFDHEHYFDMHYRPCPGCNKYKETFAHFMLSCKTSKGLTSDLMNVLQDLQNNSETVASAMATLNEWNEHTEHDEPTDDAEARNILLSILGDIDFIPSKDIDTQKAADVLFKSMKVVQKAYNTRLKETTRRKLVSTWKEESKTAFIGPRGKHPRTPT